VATPRAVLSVDWNMGVVRAEVPTRLRLRTCLRCGYGGPELQNERGERIYTCPACGQDLYARPPRSYAELEGLDEEDRWIGHWVRATRPENRLVSAVKAALRALGRMVFQHR
jgi:hypothetical protein